MPKIGWFEKKEISKPVYSEEEIEKLGNEYIGYMIDGKMTLDQHNQFFADKNIFRIYDNYSIAIYQAQITKYEEYRDILDLYFKKHKREKKERIEDLLP